MSLPIFKSNLGLLSILSAEPSQQYKIKTERDFKPKQDGGSNSVFDCVKEDLAAKSLFVVDDSFTSFLRLYNQSEKEEVLLRFGIRFTFCDNNELLKKYDKVKVEGSEEEINNKTDAKYYVFARTGKGVTILQKLFSECATKHFTKNNRYGRGSFDILRKYWSNPDLLLVVPFYDSFLYKNALLGNNHVPDFSFCSPVFELQSNGLPFDELIRERVLNYCKTNHYNTLNSQTIYYRKQEDFKAFQVYKIILNRGRGYKEVTLERPELEFFSSDEFSAEKAAKLPKNEEESNWFEGMFEDYRKTLKHKGVIIPQDVVAKETLKEMGISENATNNEILTVLCRNGWKKWKINDRDNKDEYTKMVKYELGVLEKLGFTSYILMIWDMIKWCDDNKIPRGWGRGSLGGSLVAYLLGLTVIDPIKEKLSFTRFINESRTKTEEIDGVKYLTGNLADIDCDLSFEFRDRVVNEYLKNKYKNRVCGILTETKLTTKSCIKDVAKIAFDWKEADIINITSMVDTLFGKNETIEEATEKNPEFAKWAAENNECVKICNKLMGLVRNYGAHASGFAITHDDLENVLPIQLDANGEITSSYTKTDVEKIAIKLDCLGLKTIDIIYRTAKDVGFDFNSFDVYGTDAYQFLDDLASTPYGIFQLEGNTALRILTKVKPKIFSETAAISAIARPGSISFVPDFEKFMETGQIKKIYDPIDEILKETGGLILYQEDLMLIASRVYKFTELEADDIRKCVGRKLKEEIKKWESRIKDRGTELNIPENVTNLFWSTVQKSADYMFSKNHNYPYNYLSILCLHLKFNYPLQFFKNCLDIAQKGSDMQYESRLIIRELPYFGIKVCPPSFKRGNIDFEVDPSTNTIYTGFSALKSFSDATISKLPHFISLDKSTKFNTFEGAKQSGLNITAIVNLIMCGCLDEFSTDGNRQKLVLECKTFHLLTEKEKNKINEIAAKYNYNLFAILEDIKKDVVTTIMSKKATEKRKSRFDNFYANYLELKTEYQESLKNQLFDSYCAEKKILGYSFSNTLLNIFKPKCEELVDLEKIIGLNDRVNHYVTFCGMIDDVHYGKTKKDKKLYAKLYISDEKESIVGFLSEDSLPENPEDVLIKDSVIFCRGQKRKSNEKDLRQNLSPALSIDNIRILRKI